MQDEEKAIESLKEEETYVFESNIVCVFTDLEGGDQYWNDVFTQASEEMRLLKEMVEMEKNCECVFTNFEEVKVYKEVFMP